MELAEVIGAQAVRFLQVVDDTKPARPLLPIVKALEARYLFLQVPSRVEDYNFSTGVTFLQGVFRESIAIDKFQVYTNGILCESKLSTETCDEFLDDVLRWAEDELGLPVPERSTIARAYFSRLEVRASADIGAAFKLLSSVGYALSSKIAAYGHTYAFHPSGLRLNVDPAVSPTNVFEFAFERRAGKPHSENAYFTSAPLSTSDHKAILDELEVTLLRS